MGALAPDNSHSTAQLIDAMPEAFVSTAAISREVSRQFKAGRLRKLGFAAVHCQLVGTLERGFDLCRSLETPSSAP